MPAHKACVRRVGLAGVNWKHRERGEIHLEEGGGTDDCVSAGPPPAPLTEPLCRISPEGKQPVIETSQTQRPLSDWCVQEPDGALEIQLVLYS